MKTCRLQKDFLNAKQVFHYQDRSIYYTDIMCIELWYDARTTFNTTVVSGLSVQDRICINPETI